MFDDDPEALLALSRLLHGFNLDGKRCFRSDVLSYMPSLLVEVLRLAEKYHMTELAGQFVGREVAFLLDRWQAMSYSKNPEQHSIAAVTLRANLLNEDGPGFSSDALQKRSGKLKHYISDGSY